MIIIISGTSSSGKSTVSQALQRKLGDNWLLFSTDEYLSMLGEKFLSLHPNNKEVLTPNNICYAVSVNISSFFNFFHLSLCYPYHKLDKDTPHERARPKSINHT
jgi:deoxyadenosine/deoxycytidine kinase